MEERKKEYRLINTMKGIYKNTKKTENIVLIRNKKNRRYDEKYKKVNIAIVLNNKKKLHFIIKKHL